MFGEYRYAMYVFHWPVAYYVRSLLPRTALGQRLRPRGESPLAIDTPSDLRGVR